MPCSSGVCDDSTLADMAMVPPAFPHARPHGLQLPAAKCEEPMIAVRMLRRSKYGAQAVVIDGIRFASKREAKRYAELKLLAKAGEIRNLQLQVKIPFQVGGNNIFIYIADFTYNNRTGQLVVEDVKGARTPVYRLKKKLIEAYYGIEITEI
jgi:hypothetical protein